MRHTNSLLDIIGRTDTNNLNREARKQKKGPRRALLNYFGILTELFQSWPGNLKSYSLYKSARMYLALSWNLALGLFFSYQRTLSSIILNKKNNCSSVNLLYIFILLTPLACGTLRGGITIKYDEVAREGEAEILECKPHVVKSESQENKKHLTGVKK